jgi:integrase/recombinase XerC
MQRGKGRFTMNLLSRKATPTEKQLADYLEYCEFNKKMTPTTMCTKRKAIDRFLSVNPSLQDFTKLTNDQFDRWRAQLAKEGKAGKTINNYADHILGLLRHLQDRRKCQLKINLSLVERAEEDDSDVAYFTRDDMQRIQSACRGLRELLLIDLIYVSGLRISETTKLRLENVSDLTICIRGKGRKLRTTFITPDIRAILDRWLMLNGITEGYIFPSPTKFDKPLSVQQIRETINAPIRRAGFEKGSAHAIRHAFVTKLINSGADIFTVQTLVGHDDPKTTRGYFHKNREQLGKQYAKFMTSVT